jgi:formylglycine-generating enzyme required for sulfatase activity
MARIFISYRRDVSAVYARLIAERMRMAFGRRDVFLDTGNLEYGADFVEQLEEQLRQCRVMLVLMHPSWPEVADAKGRRRLDSPADYVRVEVETALKNQIRVVPVLLDGAALPEAEALPETMRSIVRRQALSFELKHADSQFDELIAAIRRMPGMEGRASIERPLLVAAGATALIAVGVLAWRVFPGPAPTPTPALASSGTPIPNAPVAPETRSPTIEAAPVAPAVVAHAPAPAATKSNAKIAPTKPPQTKTAPASVVTSAPAPTPATAVSTTTPSAAPAQMQVFRDCDQCPEMVVIPAGSFQMGSEKSEPGRRDNEGPVHPVSLQGFALGKTAVTQGEWKALMGSNPSHFTACGDSCPVEQMSWNDAQDYLRRLIEKTGKRYRLPTEAEWEYACRAGSRQIYCGGDDLDSVAWTRGNSGGSTHPVAQKRANAWGLYDMTGNIWQWVEDCHHDSYSGAPSDGTAWAGGTCDRRVSRGGSWGVIPQSARAAARGGLDVPANRGVWTFGFRVARMLP